MAVKVGSARIDENGNAKGGAAGDQTGGEVSTQNWYLHSKGWVVLRCKSAAMREKIATAMERACANNQIGYDQWQRDTLWNDIKDQGWDPSKTTKNVETDCSALVRVCIAYAYSKDLVGNIRTINEPTILANTGEFEKLTATKYTKSSDYLLRGDILCTPTSGHTVVVLNDGAKVTTTATTTVDVVAASSFDKSIAGAYKVTASKLNVRRGPGSGYKSIAVLSKGDTVRNYGYFTGKWYYVAYSGGTAWVSSGYLKKV